MKGINQVTLEKLKVAFMMDLGDLLQDPQVDVSQQFEFFRDTIHARIKGFVWAEEEAAQRIAVKYPSDWWQAFKERYFTDWMLKRWPVQYERFAWDVRCLYPEFRPALPNQKYVLSIMERQDLYE
jgi:hypothetical protein